MTAQLGDLTNIANVKAWLNTSTQAYPTSDDALLARLITSASSFVRSWLSSPVVPARYTETRNGTGTSRLFLRNRPVVSVSSLTVCGESVPASSPSPTGYGYLYDDTTVYLVCSLFPYAPQVVTAVYSAGYQAQASPAIAASVLVSSLVGSWQTQGVMAAVGPWNSDVGVTLNGAAMTLVSGPPAPGQYQLTQSSGAYQYNFNASDVSGAGTLVITYGATPADMEQAVIELLSERFKTRSRIGQDSVHLASETVSYSTKDMNDFVKSTLQQYRNVVPVG